MNSLISHLPPPKIAVVHNESHDWVALYLDGRKVEEGHTLQLRDVFDALEIKAEFIEIEEPANIEGEVNFADKLQDVRFAPYEEIEG